MHKSQPKEEKKNNSSFQFFFGCCYINLNIFLLRVNETKSIIIAKKTKLR